MNKTIPFLFFLFLPFISYAQKHVTVSGHVMEAGSKELLPATLIYNPETEKSTYSNAYGFYSLSLAPADSITLFISSPGFNIDTVSIPFHQDITLNVNLKSSYTRLEQVVVTAEKKASEVVQMSSLKLSPMEVKSLPALFGEKDVFKTLLLFPGVQSASEGTSGIYVRGGSADQNLIILDEATIYNASHLLGFFSIFNGDAIRSVELIKGGFPARYGGRLSSVIDVRMKDGNKQEFHGEGGIGLISSHLVFEGPIIKDKASFMISARRTYFDLLIRPVMSLMASGTTAGYFFHDFNAKFNFDLGEKDKIFISGYWGKDKFYLKSKDKNGSHSYKSDMSLFWQNGTASVRWNHIFANKFFANMSLIFNDYTMSIGMEEEENKQTLYKLRYNSGIRDYALKYDLTYNLNANHTLLMGASFTLHQSSPQALVWKDEFIDSTKTIRELGLESAIYMEDEISLGKWKLNPGVRFVLFSVDNKSYFMPEPRFSASYNVRNNLALKVSYALMNQYMILISSTSIGLPTDLWVPVTNKVKPQRSQQVAIGAVYDWARPKLSFSIEGYYKKMDNILGLKEGSSFMIDALEGMLDPNMAATPWEENVTAGQGWAYGAEFLIRKTAGKFTGWVGYTLSWVQHQFDEHNFGEKYFARYDRRHDVSIVLIYSPTPRVNLSLTWTFATGNAVTMPQALYESNGLDAYLSEHFLKPESGSGIYYSDFIESYGEKNNLRMRPFHHLDVNAQFIKPHKKGKFTSIFEVSIYNIYNNKNAFFYYTDSGYGSNRAKIYQVSIFPIIPTFTYHFKF
ncbi:MAG: TonB-dependent receptor [Bacteroidales bacterium]|jgi:hypothetical protein|nr:TonB-dependent receptor [Bacteroidales bacterium]